MKAEDAGTLDKAKKPIKIFWRNCRYGILYSGQRYVVSILQNLVIIVVS